MIAQSIIDLALYPQKLTKILTKKQANKHRQPIMEFMQQELRCSTMDQYRIIKTLGGGYHSTVKLAMDPNGIQVAIKRYKIQTADLATLNKQLSIMKDLSHQNLIRLIDARDKAEYTNRQGKTYTCLAIIIEYASGGQLFGYLAYSGRFSEKVARTYFNQMMNGLYYLHKMGYAHRDLKPENILLSREFVLKVADFGFATIMEGKNKSGVLHTNLGSEGYKAPEIYKKQYIGWQTDVFAAGVILFIMLKGTPPFDSANPEDRVYSLIKDKNYKHFWKIHSQKHPKLFSQQFKDLFVRMVAYDPNERPTIEEIAGNAWVRKEVCSHQQVIKEFMQRKQKVKQGEQKAKKEQQKKREQRMLNALNQEKSRGKQGQNQFYSVYVSQMNKKRELEPSELLTVDGFLVKEKADYFIANLKNALENQPIILQDESQGQEVLIDDDEQQEEELQSNLIFDSMKQFHKNKIDITYVYTQSLGEHTIKSNVKIQIELGCNKRMKDSLVVNIRKVKGEHIFYKKIVNQIRRNFIYCIMDHEEAQVKTE